MRRVDLHRTGSSVRLALSKGSAPNPHIGGNERTTLADSQHTQR
jgi:hypothetical protein